MMSIPERPGNMIGFNQTCDAHEVTTIPCGACELSFTAECGRDAIILLVKHLRDNLADAKHREAFDWTKNTVLSPQPHQAQSKVKSAEETRDREVSMRQITDGDERQGIENRWNADCQLRVCYAKRTQCRGEAKRNHARRKVVA
jgi:hypothetical protein